MPKTSERVKMIQLMLEQCRDTAIDRVTKDQGSDEDGHANQDQEFWENMLIAVFSQRYIFPRRRAKQSPSNANYYLYDMPAAEFQLHFRLRRGIFFAVCGQLGDSPVSKNAKGKLKKKSVHEHLLCLMKTLGSGGNTAAPQSWQTSSRVGMDQMGFSSIGVLKCLI